MMCAALDTSQGTQVNINDYVSIRRTGPAAGHGTRTIAISPDQIQLFAESLFLLTLEDENTRGKSQAIIDAVVAAAELKLAASPGLVLKTHDDVPILLSKLGIDSE